MSVTTTMTRFATVWQNYSDDANGQRIEKTFDRIPRQIFPAHLPCVVIFPGAATYDKDQYGEQMVKETRQYKCVVAVSVATFGNMETGETLVEPYFDTVRDYFAARPGLEDDNAVQPQDRVMMSDIQGDGGYFIFEYPSGNGEGSGLGIFHAVEFSFEIQELVKNTYKD